VEAAHSLAKWDSGPLGQFYARKAQEIGRRKAIIALACKLLIVAWRMLLRASAAESDLVARGIDTWCSPAVSHGFDKIGRNCAFPRKEMPTPNHSR
jgi:hypothetical protein